MHDVSNNGAEQNEKAVASSSSSSFFSFRHGRVCFGASIKEQLTINSPLYEVTLRVKAIDSTQLQRLQKSRCTLWQKRALLHGSWAKVELRGVALSLGDVAIFSIKMFCSASQFQRQPSPISSCRLSKERSGATIPSAMSWSCSR
jgi:hypothetical protein